MEFSAGIIPSNEHRTDLLWMDEFGLLIPRDLRESSPTLQVKASIASVLSKLSSQSSTSLT